MFHDYKTILVLRHRIGFPFFLKFVSNSRHVVGFSVDVIFLQKKCVYRNISESGVLHHPLHLPRPTEREGQTGRLPGAHKFKQVESCFLNHNSSILFCCTDSSLRMTHRGGLSLSIIIWGSGASFLLPWGPKILLAALLLPYPGDIIRFS